MIGRACDDDENARWRCGVVVVARCARRRVEYFAYFYVVSMTARSSEVDDERDEWEGMGTRARGVSGRRD